MASSRRIKKLNELIKRELSKIVLEKFSFAEEALVTLTRVDTAGDLSQVKVFISVVPDEKFGEVIKKLKHNSSTLRKHLGNRLKIRKTPEIKIKEDKSTRKADRVEKILEEIKKGKKD